VRLECCRHDHEAQVRTRSALEAPQEREGDVAVEVPLVELVEDNRVHPAQFGVREEPSREHAFG